MRAAGPYIAAMQLAGRYSYAGREWVIEGVRKSIGGRVDLLAEGFGASRLDRRQPIGEHRSENVDHLPMAVIGELASHGPALQVSHRSLCMGLIF
jgi:hypothetical protein